MEVKKRKRSQSDDPSLHLDTSTKKSKYDHLFDGVISHLDQEARSKYIASPAAQAVLQAIARKDPDFINGSHAPPGLETSRQRKRWRDAQRRVALHGSKPPLDIDHKPAVLHGQSKGNPIATSKALQREESLTSIKRDDITKHFFTGTGSRLDSTSQAAYLATKAAQDVIDAVARGDADSIYMSHAPSTLTKAGRKAWRDEQKQLAASNNEVPLQHDGCDAEQSVDVQASINANEGKPKGLEALSSNDAVAASSSSSGETNGANMVKQGLNARSVGFTPLMRPPQKDWDDPHQSLASSRSKTAQSKVKAPASKKQSSVHEDETSLRSEQVRRSSSVSWNPAAEEYPGARSKTSGPAPGASNLELRRGSSTSSTRLHRQRSRESATNLASRRIPGNRNFDVPDVFTGGTLEDTQRRFEAWARAQRGGKSDSSDSDSCDDSDNDIPVAAKSAVRGSFHESWADQINRRSVVPSSNGQASQSVDEHVVERSESEDEEDVDDEIEVQTQVSKELNDTAAALDETQTDVEHPSAPSEPIIDEEEEATVEENATKAVEIEMEHEGMASGQPIDQSSLDDPKLHPSTPQTRPSGTTYGLPNTPRQANVRVKRILSSPDPGGDRSGHGPTQAAKPTSKENIAPDVDQSSAVNMYKDQLDKGELSDDLYAAIDDVTSSVLGTVSSAPSSERMPSMNECKPLNAPDFNNGQDRNPLITNDASALATSNLDEHEDVMEGLEEEVLPDRGGSKAEGEAECRGEKFARKNQEHCTRRPPSSELIHTPSPPNASGRLPGEPQVVISPYIPATPEVVTQERTKKTRKMTGRSSKHFSVAKQTKKSTQLGDSILLSTPAVQTAPGLASSVYETAVSRRTRSAAKETSVNLGREDMTPKQLLNLPPKAVAADCSPLSYLEEALKADDDPETPCKTQGAASKGNVLSANDEDIDPSSPQTFVTPKESPEPDPVAADPQTPPQTRSTKSKRNPRSKAKSTGRISNHFITDRVDLYNTTASSKRVPAGTSRVPVPSIEADQFGIIQEKLWREPFWLLVAVTFLNKTAGRSAVPIFWKLKQKYPTPEDLATADVDDLLEMIHRLGLQNQRSKRLILIAKAWCEGPPQPGKRFRTLNYPNPGDGRAREVPNIVEEDADDCAGALEVGHIPGCGDYAWDSWRIFCRDVLRGVADDYNGLNRKNPDFEPEWKRVLPKDKELRACLRWMWLRDDWIWDPLTGDKREATEGEMEQAVKGEMEIADPQERKFAVQAAAAGGEIVSSVKKKKKMEEDETPSKPPTQTSSPDEEVEKEKEDDALSAQLEAQVAPTSPTSDTITVAPFKTRRRTTPNRATRIEPSVEVDDEPEEKAPSSKTAGGGKRRRKSAAPESEAPRPGSKHKAKAKTKRSIFRDDDDEEFGSRRRRRSKRLTRG